MYFENRSFAVKKNNEQDVNRNQASETVRTTSVVSIFITFWQEKIDSLVCADNILAIRFSLVGKELVGRRLFVRGEIFTFAKDCQCVESLTFSWMLED